MGDTMEDQDNKKYGIFSYNHYLESPVFDSEDEAKKWAEKNGYDLSDATIEEVYDDDDDDDWAQWCADHPLPGDDCLMLGI